MFEPYTSLTLKIAQRTFALEGWDDNADVYDETTPCNDPDKPWSANNSIPKILFFKNVKKLSEALPNLRLKYKKLCECLTFANSGGVNYHTFHIPLGDTGYKVLKGFDSALVALFPNVFAMGCKVVLERSC